MTTNCYRALLRTLRNGINHRITIECTISSFDKNSPPKILRQRTPFVHHERLKSFYRICQLINQLARKQIIKPLIERKLFSVKNIVHRWSIIVLRTGFRVNHVRSIDLRAAGAAKNSPRFLLIAMVCIRVTQPVEVTGVPVTIAPITTRRVAPAVVP